MKTKTSPARRPLTRLTHSLCCAGLAALATSACNFDSGVEDLGSTDAVSQDLDTPPPVVEPFYSSANEFAGLWIGVADDALALALAPGEAPPTYRFPSGATNIVLDLEFRDESLGFPNLTGKISFGAGEPPAPPSDPNVGYPAGLSYIDLYAYDPAGPLNPQSPALQVIGDPGPLPPLEGYAYWIQQIAFPSAPDGQGVPDGVALLSYWTAEYLVPWCELQAPVPDGEGGYGCLAPYDQLAYDDGACVAINHDDSACPPNLDLLPFAEQASVLEHCVVTTNESVDCDKLFLCSGIDMTAPDNGRCFCDASGCTGNYRSTLYDDSANLMLRRNGDELVGVINDGWFVNERGLRVPLGTIRFQRVQ